MYKRIIITKKKNKQNMTKKLSSNMLFIDKVKVNIRSMYPND